MKDGTAARRLRSSSRIVGYASLGAVLLLTACDVPPPRNFTDFMEDRIAREGTLARCNQNREETLNDIECANARRAEAAIALRQERERRETLERESERKLAALRDEIAARDQAARAAVLAAEAAKKAEYEAQWQAANGPADITEAGGSVGIPSPAADGGLPAPNAQAQTQPAPLLAPVALPGNVSPLDAEQNKGPQLEEIVVPRPFRHE